MDAGPVQSFGRRSCTEDTRQCSAVNRPLETLSRAKPVVATPRSHIRFAPRLRGHLSGERRLLCRGLGPVGGRCPHEATPSRAGTALPVAPRRLWGSWAPRPDRGLRMQSAVSRQTHTCREDGPEREQSEVHVAHAGPFQMVIPLPRQLREEPPAAPGGAEGRRRGASGSHGVSAPS
jgi:hypothetical protein